MSLIGQEDSGTCYSLQPGIILSGRFRLVRRLGGGGMGEVWLAHDMELDAKPVALKVLHDIAAKDTLGMSELKKELLITRDLRHKHIVGVYDVHLDSSRPCISMEYVEGTSLGEALLERKRAPFDLPQVLSWAGQVAVAVDYAHSRNILHRDIKPANILLDKSGEIRVADFGIARTIQGSQASQTGGGVSGTYAYMSPQQLTDDKKYRNDTRNDVYSFAATCYELLSGAPPFQRGDLPHQILHKTPDLIEGVPDQVNFALQRGLAKRVEDRPEDCAQLAAWVSGEAMPELPTTEIRTAAPVSTPAPILNSDDASSRQKKRVQRAVMAVSVPSILLGVLGFVFQNTELLSLLRRSDAPVTAITAPAPELGLSRGLVEEMAPEEIPEAAAAPTPEVIETALATPAPSFVARVGLYRDSGEFLEDHATLFTGDAFHVTFYAPQKTFLYVFNINSRGIVLPMFPHPGLESGSLVPPGQMVRLPADDHNYILEGDSTGEERVVFVMAEQAVPELEALIEGFAEKPLDTSVARFRQSMDRGLLRFDAPWQGETARHRTPAGLETLGLSGRGVIIHERVLLHRSSSTPRQTF